MEQKLHIIIFPFIAHGHMIPTIDMAKLFTSRGLKTTIICTPAFAEPIQKARDSGIDIGLSLIKFPPEGSDLPDHIVSLNQVTSDELVPKFIKAMSLLQEPLEKLIEELKPHCLVSDMFWPWTVDSASRFGIPRLVFHGTGYFALCAAEEMKRHKPFKNVSSDIESFVVPNLPHEVKLVRTQVPDFDLMEDENKNYFVKLMNQVRDSDWKSYGVVVNSFYELEPDYADHYRDVLGRKAWNVGPLLLSNGIRENEKLVISGDECLAWLDAKKPNSVVYVCFGSMANFSAAQLHETAVGLERSEKDFIWVVRKGKKDNEEDWMPQGFEERVKGRGFIIRGWAPQVAILGHQAISAFVTHCGWNSTLEGICLGVPMVTWPIFAEQFFNEKLVVEVLRTGVPVGSKKWQRVPSEGVGREAISAAVRVVMEGERAVEMRNRAMYYKEMARKAIDEGGSSYNDMSCLIEELKVYSTLKKQDGIN